MTSEKPFVPPERGHLGWDGKRWVREYRTAFAVPYGTKVSELAAWASDQGAPPGDAELTVLTQYAGQGPEIFLTWYEPEPPGIPARGGGS